MIGRSIWAGWVIIDRASQNRSRWEQWAIDYRIVWNFKALILWNIEYNIGLINSCSQTNNLNIVDIMKEDEQPEQCSHC